MSSNWLYNVFAYANQIYKYHSAEQCLGKNMICRWGSSVTDATKVTANRQKIKLAGADGNEVDAWLIEAAAYSVDKKLLGKKTWRAFGLSEDLRGLFADKLSCEFNIFS
jgi:hypothetical protein